MEYFVGKPRFKLAIGYAIPCLAWTSTLIYFDEVWKGMKIFAIILIIIIFVIVIPGLTYSRIMWKVNENQLSYTYHDNFIDKIVAFYRHVLKDHHLTYQVNLNMSQIDYVNVTYTKVPRFPYGQYGYDILFEIHTFQGSIYTFDILGFSFKKKEANYAIEFMQRQNIRFIDEYHIIEELKKKIPISYYLESLEKRTSHD